MTIKQKFIIALTPVMMFGCTNSGKRLHTDDKERIAKLEQTYDLIRTEIASTGDKYEQMFVDSVYSNPTTREINNIAFRQRQLQQELEMLQQAPRTTANMKRIKKTLKQINECQDEIQKAEEIKMDISEYFYSKMVDERKPLMEQCKQINIILDSLYAKQK